MLEKITHEYYETVDSTNDRLKERALLGDEEGLVISAMHQSKGKGRVGRVWQSPTNDSIATSILLYPKQIPIQSVPTITILCAMAVRKALNDLYEINGQIKWPNDIVVDGKKICGILTEMQAESGVAKYVIAGIGVNVHNRAFSEDIAFKATSVDLEIAKQSKVLSSHRKDVAEAIWDAFKDYYNEFLKTADLSNLKDEYERYLVNKDKPVRIEDPKGAFEAIARGINVKGALVVETEAGMVEIESGEVSVRGIYGYV